MLRVLAFAATLFATLVGPTSANDSAAELDTGGLVLVKDPDIVLAREDLRIGLDRIAVSYVFHNRASGARTVRIAFPLPAIDGAELVTSAQSLPFENRANFVGFTVTIDGARIEPELEERAFLGSREVSELLRKHRVPLNPMRRDDVDAAIKALSPAARMELVRAGLITEEEGPGGGLWRSEAKFHWEQTFPPGSDVAIAHSYVPVKGSLLLSRQDLTDTAFRDRYCLDESGVKGLRRMLEPKGKDGVVHAAIVPYIVTTARNWAGSIGIFSLTVDKGQPKTLVSLCRSGIAKTGPTTFAWTAKDYVPDADLRVLYVSPDAGALGIK